MSICWKLLGQQATITIEQAQQISSLLKTAWLVTLEAQEWCRFTKSLINEAFHLHVSYLSQPLLQFPHHQNVDKTSCSETPLCKKAQNKHTNKVCASPALVTHASGTMPCYCHPTVPKNPFSNCSWVGAGWKYKNSHQDSLQELCRFGWGAQVDLWQDLTRQQDLVLSRLLLLKTSYSMNPSAWRRKTIWI